MLMKGNKHMRFKVTVSSKSQYNYHLIFIILYIKFQDGNCMTRNVTLKSVTSFKNLLSAATSDRTIQYT